MEQEFSAEYQTKQSVFEKIEHEKTRLYQLDHELRQIDMGVVRNSIIEACVKNAITSLNDAVHSLDNPDEES